MILNQAALKRQSTVLALLVIIVIAGLYCYATLPRESFPDITVPYVFVTTTYEGVAQLCGERSRSSHPNHRRCCIDFCSFHTDRAETRRAVPGRLIDNHGRANDRDPDRSIPERRDWIYNTVRFCL